LLSSCVDFRKWGELSLSKREYNTASVAGAFVLAGVILFGASIAYPFHFDDGLILSDANVTNAARWSHFLNPLHLRQLTYFTFYLNFLAGGNNAAGFHAVNVVIHIASSVLLFLLLKRFVEPAMALSAAALFLVHPIQTEPVFYIYQRSTLLACLFSLCALYAFQAGKHWLAALLFFLAFESKESALAVPLALGLLHRHSARKWLVAGTAAGGMAALAILMYRHEATVGVGAASSVTPLQYLGSQLRVVYTYLRLLVWPYPQSIEYEFPASDSVWLRVGEIAGVAAMLAAAAWALRRERWKVAGLAALSFFLLLAPTSSIIPSADAAFEHRLYLPMLAFSLLVAWMLFHVPKRKAVTSVLLLVMAMLTLSRGAVWASEVSLWQDAVSHAPNKARAWFNLGSVQTAADPQGARLSLRRAIDLQPHFPDAFVSFGVLEHNARNFPQAVLYFQEALRQDPKFWPAWYNLGNSWFSIGDYDRAIVSFERTLELNRDYYAAHYNIAVAHLAAGRAQEAIPHIRTVLDWEPNSVEAQQLLRDALAR
jgi:protein O-mannosyl-transferase